MSGLPSAKRIAIIYRTMAGLSGTPNTIMDHARYLGAEGFQVSLVGEKMDRRRILEVGAQAVRLRRWPLPRSLRLRHFSWRAERQARACDFVAGHGHNLHQDVLSLHNCLHLAHERTYGYALSRPGANVAFQDLLLRSGAFSFCIANSNLMRQDLLARYHLAPERVEVIYPGFQPRRFNCERHEDIRQEVRAEWGVDKSRFLLGLVTSGSFEKRGVDLAIQAVADLPATLRREVLLLVVGKEGNQSTFRQRAEACGVSSHIRFLPPTDRIERYYHGLDLCLHPARFEEFGQTVQEAMACGLPVIGSRQVGALEMLPRPVWDSLPEVMTVSALVERVQAFIGSESLCQQWRDYGLQAVAWNSDRVNFQQTLALYRRAGL